MTRKMRLSLAVIVALLVLVVALGYVSNVITYGACERHAAFEVIRVAGRGAMHVLPHGGPASEQALNGVGFKVRRCPDWCWPAAGIDRAKSVMPFVVTVKWWCARVPGGGVGMTTRFLCVFGRAIVISRHLDEVA